MVRHYGGRTTEVTNTDAEGRLVLADALAYAVAELDPDVLVDVATLTGAMKVALGQQVGGYFANDDGLADGARATPATTAGEPLWRFPLAADYEEKLSSKVADADNAPGGPGAITAALFLQHFAGEVPWAHLDIASVGDSPDDSFEWTTGPTGFGARALLQLARQRRPPERHRDEGPDRPLVPRRRPRRASRTSWRRTSPTPPTPGSPAWPGLQLQDLADARGRVVRGLLRLRLRRGARRSSRRPSPPAPPSRPARRSSAARRS